MKRLVIILFLLPFFASAQFVNNNRQIINVLNFGAKGDMQSRADGSYTGTTTFTGSGFVASDVGKTIRIQMAASDLLTTITGFTNSTTVTLANTTTGTRSSQTYDFGTNNTAAFQAAANAVPVTGATWYLPPGDYLKRGLINFPNPTFISGTMRSGIGTSDSVPANLNRPKTIIHEIASNLPQSVNIQSIGSSWEGVDLYCTATQAFITSGVGLNINASDVSLTNAQFGNFWTSVSQNYSAYFTANHCAFAGVQFGMIVQNLETADAGDWVVHDCWFGGYPAHPCSSALLILSSGGAKISDSKWNQGMHKAISVEILSSASSTGDFQFMNNSIENFDSTGINVVVKGTGLFQNIVLTGNQLGNFGAGHSTGIRMNGTGSTWLKSITVTANVIYTQVSGDTAINITAISDAIISNNQIGTNWTKDVFIDGTSTNVSYVAPLQVAVGNSTGNNGNGGTNNFTNNGLVTFIQDRLQIGNSVNSTGTVPELRGVVSNSAGYSDLDIYPTTGTNVGAFLNLMPRGTGFNAAQKSGINFFGTDFISSSSNLSFGQIYFGGSGNPWQFISTHTGSGAQIPIQFTAGGTANQLAVNTDGTIQMGTYGSGTNTGTPTFGLSVDASGKLIETASASGTYLPTFTNTTNLSSSTHQTSTYMQVGNIVNVSVVGSSVTPTAGSGASTVLTISLPVSTATTSQNQVGTGVIVIGGTAVAGTVSIVSGTTAQFSFFATGTTGSVMNATFQYKTN